MFSKIIISTFGVLLVASLYANADLNLDRTTISPVCLKMLQKQINAELHASLVYMSMAAHFNNVNVARFGFGKFYSRNSNEEREHAQKIIDYINLRGGSVGALQVEALSKSNYGSVVESLRSSLDFEQEINNMLHLVHLKAEAECRDAHLMAFIESEFLDEQIKSINEFKTLIATGSKMESSIGEYLMDQEMLRRFEKSN